MVAAALVRSLFLALFYQRTPSPRAVTNYNSGNRVNSLLASGFANLAL